MRLSVSPALGLDYTKTPTFNADVIGVVKEVGDLSSITSKATSKVVCLCICLDVSFPEHLLCLACQIPKRELTIVDRSGFSVRMTLWGKQAEQYESTDQPVIAFKGAKVGDFQGGYHSK